MLRDCSPPKDGEPYYYRLTIALVRVDHASGDECDERFTMTARLGGYVPALYERLISEVEMWDMLARGGFISPKDRALAVDPSRSTPSL
jgi:hypothetical protein